MAFSFEPGQSNSGGLGTAGPSASPDAHLGAGYLDLRSDRYDDAAREFRAALALDPKLILRAGFPLAVALFQSQKPAEARQEFESVRAEVGDRPDVMYYLGRLDLTAAKQDAAIKALSLAASNPPFPDTAYYLGSAYLKKGDLTLAEKWLREAARLAPQDARVQERLGAVYRQEGLKPGAEKAFAKAAELRQREAAVSGLRIDCAQRLESGPIEQARPVCDRLFDPSDADSLTMLGTLYGQHHDYAEALKPLRRAAELDSKSPQAQYNLALDCYQLGRYSEARDSLARVLKLWPDLFPLNALYGAALFKLAEKAPAYEALRHAHELSPDDRDTALLLYETGIGLAQASAARREYSVSVRYLNEATQLFPGEPEPHRLLAAAYKASGRESEAADEQRQFEILMAQSQNKSN